MGLEASHSSQVLGLGPLGGDASRLGDDQNSRENPSPAPKMPHKPFARHARYGKNCVGNAKILCDPGGVTEGSDDGYAVALSVLPRIVVQECHGPVARSEEHTSELQS